HPESRDEVARFLASQFEGGGSEQATFNAFVIGKLADLHAVEALPAIREAYRQGAVDCSVRGDVQDVEIELGVREARAAAPRYPPLQDVLMAGAPSFAPEIKAEWRKVGRNEPCPCGSGLKFKKC